MKEPNNASEYVLQDILVIMVSAIQTAPVCHHLCLLIIKLISVCNSAPIVLSRTIRHSDVYISAQSMIVLLEIWITGFVLANAQEAISQMSQPDCVFQPVLRLLPYLVVYLRKHVLVTVYLENMLITRPECALILVQMEHMLTIQQWNASILAQWIHLCMVKISLINVLKYVLPVVKCMLIMQQEHASIIVPMEHLPILIQLSGLVLKLVLIITMLSIQLENVNLVVRVEALQIGS